jgi:hypothetical protein
MKTSKMIVSTDNNRNRLYFEYLDAGSWRELGRKYDLNQRYVWQYVIKGKRPKSRKICERLGITIPTNKLTYTRTRNAQANEVAQHMGYKNWSQLTTVMIDWYSTIKKG